MPAIDVKTLLIITAALAAMFAGMFFVGWRRERTGELSAWSLANALVVPGTVLLALRGVAPDWASIWAGNGLLAISFGLTLAGAVLFEGGRPRIATVAGGAVLWSAACLSPVFLTDFSARVTLLSTIGALYGAAIAGVLWRGRHGLRLPSRGLAVATVGIGAALHGGRAVATPLMPVPHDFAAINASWLATIGIFGLLLSVASSHFLHALANERASERHRRVAEVDHLTGAATRRVFETRVAALLARAPERGALLFFDIDRFKAINDTHGHAVGDRVLATFAQVVREAIEPGDVLARWGGEEFVLFLAEHDFVSGHRVAEAIRRGFSERAVDGTGARLGVTVSVGLAAPALAGPDLARLVASADAAVYAAKRAGRDRVETTMAIDAAA